MGKSPIPDFPDDVVIAAFLKKDDSFDGWAIRKWTKRKFSHCALIINGVEYSSSAHRGGVYAIEHALNYRAWEYVALPHVNPQIILEFYKKTLHDDYDYWAILSFIFPFRDKEGKWTCSEWCSNALKIAGEKRLWTKEPFRISPGKLFEIVNPHSQTY